MNFPNRKYTNGEDLFVDLVKDSIAIVSSRGDFYGTYVHVCVCVCLCLDSIFYYKSETEKIVEIR